MSIWTNFRDSLIQLLLGYGVKKAADPQNTGWVETREEMKKSAVDAAEEMIVDKVLKK